MVTLTDLPTELLSFVLDHLPHLPAGLRRSYLPYPPHGRPTSYSDLSALALTCRQVGAAAQARLMDVVFLDSREVLEEFVAAYHRPTVLRSIRTVFVSSPRAGAGARARDQIPHFPLHCLANKVGPFAIRLIISRREAFQASFLFHEAWQGNFCYGPV